MTTNTIPFTKMHALGNDFMLINTIQHPINYHQLPVSLLADRHRGVGFDQLIILESQRLDQFYCRIFNADGAEVAQCGNGLRCMARFIHEEGLYDKPAFELVTPFGLIPVHIKNYENISMEMSLSSICEKQFIWDSNIYQLEYNFISLIDLGNPHAIVRIHSHSTEIQNEIIRTIQQDPKFKNGINIGLMQVIQNDLIKLRTIERGVGETFACGSNACAAVMAGHFHSWLKSKVNVQFQHGSLIIEWEKGTQILHMTGPATRVFSGSFTSNRLNISPANAR